MLIRKRFFRKRSGYEGKLINGQYRQKRLLRSCRGGAIEEVIDPKERLYSRKKEKTGYTD